MLPSSRHNPEEECEKLNAWLHDPYTRMTHTNRDVQLSVELPCKMHVPGPVVQNSLRCSVSFRTNKSVSQECQVRVSHKTG